MPSTFKSPCTRFGPPSGPSRAHSVPLLDQGRSGTPDYHTQLGNTLILFYILNDSCTVVLGHVVLLCSGTDRTEDEPVSKTCKDAVSCKGMCAWLMLHDCFASKILLSGSAKLAERCRARCNCLDCTLLHHTHILALYYELHLLASISAPYDPACVLRDNLCVKHSETSLLEDADISTAGQHTAVCVMCLLEWLLQQ